MAAEEGVATDRFGGGATSSSSSSFLAAAVKVLKICQVTLERKREGGKEGERGRVKDLKKICRWQFFSRMPCFLSFTLHSDFLHLCHLSTD
jgi:hypothetical protein